MKKSKKLKLTLMILICTLLILVGFFGIYIKKGNAYKNILPKYMLASDLVGSTVLEFEVDNSANTVYYDKDGQEVDSTEITEKNEKDYTKKEIAVNAEESLTEENYEKVVDIMKQRLNFLRVDQYRLDLDKKTGKIALTFEDDYPDDIKSFLPMEAKFELVDSNTEDVLLTSPDFTKAEASYAALDDGSYTVYLNLKLNKSGIEKINNIEQYKTSINAETEETKTNNCKLVFDGEEIVEVSYDNILLINKTLRIATAENLTSDSTINSKLNTNTIVSKFATFGKMPVIYKITAEEYVNSSSVEYIKYVIIGISVICIAVSIYFIIRFKLKGVLAVITFASNIAIFLLLIRLTDIRISLNGFAGMIGLVVLNTILIDNILKSIKNAEKTFSENIKASYLKTADSFVVMLIVFVVFAFSNMTLINSMGLLIFWGWIVTLLGNLILTVPILSVANNK